MLATTIQSSTCVWFSRQPISAGAPERDRRSDTRTYRSWRSNPNTHSARRRWYCQWDLFFLLSPSLSLSLHLSFFSTARSLSLDQRVSHCFRSPFSLSPSHPLYSLFPWNFPTHIFSPPTFFILWHSHFSFSSSSSSSSIPSFLTSPRVHCEEDIHL